MVVLLIGFGDDLTSEAIARELAVRGTDSCIIDLFDLPAVLAGVDVRDGYASGWITVNGRRVDFDAITAVWTTLLAPAIRQPVVDDENKLLAEDEWRSFLLGVFLSTRSKLWVNPPAAEIEANSKIFQLQLARSLGFEVPDTLVSNSEEELRAFMAAHGGKVAVKRVVAVRSSLPGGTLKSFIPTHLLTEQELAAMGGGNSLRLCPACFQEYVEKDSEFRVYVLGNRVIPFEILSQADPQTLVDWRRYPLRKGPAGLEIDTDRWICRPAKLPEREEELCRRIVKRLGLHYSALDLIKMPSGRFVFLEANFGGAYHWLETLTGVPISKFAAEYLTE